MSEIEQTFAGKYRMIAELGRGGMAEVNLAVAAGPAGFNKLVVIKQLRQNLADDGEFLTMFLDEARLAARLNHPNVVHTYEVVAEQGSTSSRWSTSTASRCSAWCASLARVAGFRSSCRCAS